MRLVVAVIGAAFVILATSSLLWTYVELKTDPAAEAVALSVLDDVKAGREAALRPRLTPEASAAVTPDQVRALRAYIPLGSPAARRLVNFTHTHGATEVLTVRYELAYTGEGLLYDARLKHAQDGAWRVEYFHLQRATDAQLAVNRFTLAKPPGTLAFLVIAVVSALTMLTAFIAVLRAPRFKRKWLWAIISLLGLCAFTVNWTTGQTAFQPFMLTLIGAGLMKIGFLGFFPWTLKFTLPVGAIAALWRVAKARRESKAALDAVADGF